MEGEFGGLALDVTDIDAFSLHAPGNWRRCEFSSTSTSRLRIHDVYAGLAGRTDLQPDSASCIEDFSCPGLCPMAAAFASPVQMLVIPHGRYFNATLIRDGALGKKSAWGAQWR